LRFPRAMVKDVVSIAFLVGVLIVAPLGATSPYFIITPGGTYDIGSRLQVPDEQRKVMGRMAFTAVYEQEASWGEVVRAEIAGHAEIVPAVYVRPPGVTQDQLNASNKRLIDESKPIAAYVGLRAAGYPAVITGQGVRVESVVSGMPAQGVLQAGDIITAADDQPVDTTSALIQAFNAHHIGDQVTLSIHRGDQIQDVTLGMRESPTEPGRPVIGVTITTYKFEVQLPFPVDIQSDNVGGPSAGFMFALGILDAVTDGDLTRGRYVAGTGTIAQDGTVGAVGGAAEKALAAEQDGAQLFLAPRADAEEAHRWVRNLTIVPIDRFDDAIRALCALPPLPNATSTDQPTPCG
ncbi:MAG TPA: PDZ domain-containing protein, partial [Chloroflexota bacterium]